MTAPLSGPLHFYTCGSFIATVLSVHAGCPGSSGNQYACNDDNGNGGNNACGGGLQSGLDMNVVAGATYYIRVGTYSTTATGTFFLNSFYIPPSNDDCSNAIVYTTGSTATGTLAGATNDGEAACGASSSAADAWFVMTPTQSGYLRLDTCGSTFDTVLSVHTACPGTNVNEIACDDDAGSQAPCAGTFQSVLAFGVTTGTTYHIRIAGYAGSLGSYNLHSVFIAPPNDACANAVAYAPGLNITGVTAGATTDGSATCGALYKLPDVWYVFTASCDGPVHFDTCGSNYDTVLSLHTGCPGTTANQVACNDDSYNGGNNACGVNLQSGFDYTVTAGLTYHIRVSGFNGASGVFNLHSYYISAGSDSCGSAPTVTDGSFNICNCGASTDGPEENLCPFCCADNQINNDIWFKYVAPFNGTVDVSTCGSPDPTFDTKLAIYAGGCTLNPDTAITCNDDASCGTAGTLSSVTFPCTRRPVLPDPRRWLQRTSRGGATLTITGHQGCGSAPTSTVTGTSAPTPISRPSSPAPAGHCLGPALHLQRADFNHDGDIGTDADIESFFRVLAGGHC